MSFLRITCPDSHKVFEVKPFGEGGGQETANRIGAHINAKVPLLAKIPMEIELREGGDTGSPIVLSNPESEAAQAFAEMVEAIQHRKRSIAGLPLGLNPQG
ncbi:B-cell lymphoma 3 protein [Platysternon megacephalum]|uniref:B-cell lymphoma 3 protein n=1 Tax=Platysternon megacephalum TaxID=55544 RepID=A0A4D9DD79_9SAUR|nr:B-cell lymphoma 3 protein [Platysternon megacephalum]